MMLNGEKAVSGRFRLLDSPIGPGYRLMVDHKK